MVSKSGAALHPVVHIRIVCEEKPERHSCDFCNRSFPSEELLSDHINTQHKSLNIQDVYVCSVCRCCLLTQWDLLDHLILRHKMQLAESSIEEMSVCEICGEQLPSNNLYNEHLEIYHTSELLHNKDYCSLSILELTLTDIWSMGMGNPDCKTLFKILEVPVKEDSVYQNIEDALDSSGNTSAVKFVSCEVMGKDGRCKEHTSFSDSHGNTVCVDDGAETSITLLKENELNSVCKSGIKNRDTASTIHIQDTKSVEKTIQYNSENSMHTESKGELILTVESDEKLIWSKDIVSKVLSSCSILSGTKSCIEEADVIVEKYEDCCSLNQPLHETQANKERIWQTEETAMAILPSTVSVKMQIETDEGRREYYNHPESQNLVTEAPDSDVERKYITLSGNDASPQLSRGDDGESFGKIVIELSHDDDSKTATLELSGNTDEDTSVKFNKNIQQQHSKDEDAGSMKPIPNRKTCRICGILFSNYQMLEKHENDVHGIRIKCHLCDCSFAYSKSLRTHHQRKHSDASHFQCEICQKSFKSRSNLWTHRLTHSSYSSRKFKCPKCPLRYHSKSKLNNHLQNHSGNKKYQCGECKKGFSYPGILLKHMEKHFTEAHKNLPENESLYLVEVEVEDTNTTSKPAEELHQAEVPSSSNS